MRKLYSKVSGEIRLEYINQYGETEVIDSLIYYNRAERNKVIRLWRKLYPQEIRMFYFLVIPTINIISICTCQCGCEQSFEVMDYNYRKYIWGHNNYHKKYKYETSRTKL